jgi:SNF2 family DNA or RNA helicase
LYRWEICRLTTTFSIGLGKTIQIIALLAALQNKKGNKCDLKDIRTRQEAISNSFAKAKADQDDTLLRGGTIAKTTDAYPKLPYSPILIIVPPSVLTNWENEFKTWGYFAVASYRDANRAIAIERIACGMEDIMLCGKSMLVQKKDFNELLTIQWSLIIIDEYHDYKNHNSSTFKHLEALRNSAQCPIVGMTGTLMANNHRELYNLIDLVQPGLLGEWKDFQHDYSRPIKLARTKDAKPNVLAFGDARNEELKTTLKHVHLRREKSMYLEDDLPTK